MLCWSIYSILLVYAWLCVPRCRSTVGGQLDRVRVHGVEQDGHLPGDGGGQARQLEQSAPGPGIRQVQILIFKSFTVTCENDCSSRILRPFRHDISS